MRKKITVAELFERWRARQVTDHKRGGLKFSVQYIWPVNNPEYNVGMERGHRVFKFYVPINHPEAHNMGFQELLEAAQLSDSFTVSTPLNNTVGTSSEETVVCGR